MHTDGSQINRDARRSGCNQALINIRAFKQNRNVITRHPRQISTLGAASWRQPLRKLSLSSLRHFVHAYPATAVDMYCSPLDESNELGQQHN